MDAYEIHRDTHYRIIGRLADVIYINVLRENFQSTFGSLCVIVLIVCYISISIYTMVAFDTDLTIKCIGCFGIAFQGPFKFFTATIFKENIQKNMSFLREMYQCNESGPNVMGLETFAKIFSKVVKLAISLIMLTGSSFLIFPMYSLLMDGKFEPILPVNIPFVNGMELQGYLVTSAMNLFCIGIACLGTAAADLLFLSVVLHLKPISDVFQNRINELNRSLRREDIQLSKVQLRNVILMHQELYE